MMTRNLVWLLAIALSSPATAQDASGSIGELMVECRGMVESVEAQVPPRNKVGAGVCSGYLYGIADATRVATERGLGSICVPDSASIAQLGRVFLKWAETHPESQHMPRSFGVLNAYIGAFPCKR